MIYEVKKWKIFQIKQMNEKYLQNFRLLKKFDKYINFYGFYELSINVDFVTEFTNLELQMIILRVSMMKKIVIKQLKKF